MQRNKARESEPLTNRRRVGDGIRVVSEKEGTYELSFSSDTPQVMRWDAELGCCPEILLHTKDAVDLTPYLNVGSVLRNHDADQIIGAPVSAEIDETECKGRSVIRFGNTQVARDAKQDVTDKVLRGVSFGYDVSGIQRVRANEKATFGNRTYQGPCVVCTKWSVNEVSLTPIPADTSVGVGRSTSLAREAGKEGEAMNPKLIRAMVRTAGLPASFAEKLIEKKLEDVEAVEAAIEVEREKNSDVQRAKTQEPAPVAAPAPVADNKNELEKERKAAQQAERKRGMDIRGACKNAKLSNEFADELVNSGESMEGCYRKIVEKLGAEDPGAVAAPGTRIEHGEDAADKEHRHLSVNLCRRLGQYYTPTDEENKVEREHVTLMDLASRYLASVGVSTRGMSREQIAREAFTLRTAQRAASANVSGSLPYLLGNVQSKVLLKAYLTAQETWRMWCSVGSLPDFKAADRIRLSELGDLAETGEDGEILDSQISDEREQIRLAVYARMISLTWQMFVNDDISGLSRIPAAFGRSAARLPGRLVYTALLSNPTMSADSVALFDTSANAHGNYDNTATAIAEDLLKTAVKNFRRQTCKQAPNDSDEFSAENIGVDPRFLLCPPELEFPVYKLLNSPASTSTTYNAGVVNPAAKLGLVPAIEPRLSNSGYTGYSLTAWYLVGSPDQIDTCEVAFLDGNQNPRVETQEAFDILGAKTRIYLPVGVKFLDHRGIHKSVGA